MDRDVRVGEVGYCCLVSIPLRFENEALFVFAPIAKEAASDVDAQLERHVEPEVLAHFPRLEAGQIVNRGIAIL